jgi:hypothetical protein
MILPTFIIAGAPRSGTTYLYALCDSHPHICMAKPVSPEPKFFLVDEEYAHGLDYYAQRYFAAAGDYTARGEKSSNYLESAAAADRIHHLLPHVRLVFILRNPIERAFSNYLWSRQNGLESLSFSEALAQETEREQAYTGRWRYARPHSYRSRGCYADLLRPYLERFPRSQITVMLFEEILAAPEASAAALFRFLGVEACAVPFDFSRRINAAEAPADRMTAADYNHLCRYYAEPNRALADILQRSLAVWDRPRHANAH